MFLTYNSHLFKYGYTYDGWTEHGSAKMVQALLVSEGPNERVPPGRAFGNRIATFDVGSSTFNVQRSYLWGLDLSGTLQGAGGVGGLLKESEFDSNSQLQTSHFCLYDANGNITQKLDNVGNVVMNVAYDPFGNIVSGTLTGEYGFSTKPFVDGIDWYYYGYRFYDPALGRWLNRDPIGEQGGLNLYGFVGNDPVGKVDFLGFKRVPFLFIEVFSVEVTVLSVSVTTGKKLLDILIELTGDLNAAVTVTSMFKTKQYEVYKEQTVKDCYEQSDKELKKERSNWWFGGQSALSFGYGYTLRETTEYIYEPKSGYDEDCCKI